MAWFSGITGKAENFLNKLDQTAATVLHEGAEEETGQPAVISHASQPVSGRGHTHYFSSDTESKQYLTPLQSVPLKLHDLSSPGDTGSQSSFTAPKSKTVEQVSGAKKKLDSDEALFEFLNSSEQTDRRKSTPVNSTLHSRQSSTSSNISNKGTKAGNGGPPSSSSTSGSSMVHVDMPGPDSRDSPTDADVSADMVALEDALQDHSPSTSVHSSQEVEHHTDVMNSSSLDLENKLLKSEIASLNQEMASVMQRAKDSHEELVKVKKEMSSRNFTASKTDQMIRELQAREQDLMEGLKAKDSQLAILRVRLEEADREVQTIRKSVGNLQQERQRILRDHDDSSGIHGQALDSMKHKLTEVEDALQREQEAYRQSQQEAAHRQAKLEEEQRSLADALTASERKLTEEKGKISELSTQLKAAKSGSDAAKLDLSEYKEKATRILQSKERLISSLRDGSGAFGETDGVSTLEFETVKQERDMFKEEIQQSRMTMENLRLEISDLESQLQQESDSAQDQIGALEDNISEEKQRREDAEQELLKIKRELQYTIEEIHKQKSSFQSRVNDREAEIEKLRNQLATKSMSSTTEFELESRVRDLTESLIQKQTMVEALSTEKNSLGLQLERLGQQYKDIQASSVRPNSTVIPVHEDEEVRHRIPTFMREGPTDTEVTRKMKRAANTIDRFSIRLGIFLRRYPIARVFVILYMALLHLWVMVVLLTYQPEIHGNTHLPQEPQEPPN